MFSILRSVPLKFKRGTRVDEQKLGWKEASTFPGFCAKHDSETFKSIELENFTGIHEQCVLQAYRCVCNEFYKKNGLIEVLDYQKRNVDRGFDLDRQISFQIGINKSIANTKKSIDELIILKQKYEKAIFDDEWKLFKSVCYFFDQSFDVVSFGIPHAEFTFDGRKLVDIWDLSLDVSALTHSVLATSTGGAFFFCWETSSEDCKEVVRSFSNIPDDEKSDIFIQYCFLSSENTYFSKVWWDGLDVSTKERLKALSAATYYDGGSFVVNSNRLVNWKITHALRSPSMI